ncbi:acyltransferase family protein [Macrococcoides caseolyticum]|uniref:acyltransferase family protein n=1 Tax=Macrococcoides caseolyticum TaxID=69966 RepID=UPI003B016295
MKRNRNTKIDILRAIAMICIFIAHAKPNPIIFEIRNFDVIMIVILLGASFYLSTKDKQLHYISYILKRFNRLIVPTWIFLTIFFFIFYLYSKITNFEYFTLPQIIESYKLLGGIGFVWIMKVFFLVALTSPFLLAISNKIKSHYIYFLLLSVAYLIYQFLYLMLPLIPPSIKLYYNLILLEGIGYSIVAAIGIRLLQLDKKVYILLTIFMSFIYIISAIYLQFESTQLFKYPPQHYYISYGAMMTLIFYQILNIKIIHDFLNNKLMQFISRHSMWLYLWHIIPIYIIKFHHNTLFNNFVGRFFTIILISFLLTLVHHFIVKKIKHS